MRDPLITINGKPLSDAQAMTVRVAIENFASDLNDPDFNVGPIEVHYKQRIAEIRIELYQSTRYVCEFCKMPVDFRDMPDSGQSSRVWFHVHSTPNGSYCDDGKHYVSPKSISIPAGTSESPS
jgi:hypothetical protein